MRNTIARLLKNWAICPAWPALAFVAFMPMQAAAAAAADLTVTRIGSGSGMVTSTPAGINCGIACYSRYPRNSSVSLTATPASGSTFAGWSGACTGTGMTVSVFLKSRSTTCTANFGLATAPASPNVILSVTRAGAGTGSVNSAPAGIACGSACAYSFAQNTTVTLTATAAGGSTFSGWSGNCTGTTASTAIVVFADSNCTATFTAAQFSLTVTPLGTGSGIVSSSPVGISCGSACTYNFAQNSTVTLAATAATGSTIAGWSGSCGGTTASTSIVLSANSICFATFTAVVATSGAANLSWDPVTSAALSGYRVYYGTSAGNYQQAPGLGLNAGSTANFTVAGLTSGIRYYFAVTAYDAANFESGYSNEAVKDVP